MSESHLSIVSSFSSGHVLLYEVTHVRTVESNPNLSSPKVMKLALEIILIVAGSVNLILSRFALFSLRQPTTPAMWLVKVITSGLSPILFVVGSSLALLGVVINSLPAVVIGSLGATLYLLHITVIIRKPDSLERIEGGEKLEVLIPKDNRRYYLPLQYVFRLPDTPKPVVQRNISFYTTEDSNTHLYCDIWQPQKDIRRSCLAFIYLHGSAWTSLDKDYGTRTFFKHLAAQGHVIMDVAYRLFPETNLLGMVHDTKHAIAWMKANAERFGVNPDRIVIGGGSAGAHLALLAAYSNKSKVLTPEDLRDIDISVSGFAILPSRKISKANKRNV